MTRKKTRFLNIIIWIIAFIIAFFGAHQSAYGASVPYASGIINDVDGANIRSTFSTDSKVVGGAPYQGSVLITKERFTSTSDTAKTSRWFYVQSGYANGWIRADLLDVSYGSIEGKISKKVNVRKGPGTSFEKVILLNAGDMVDVRLTVYSSAGEKWYKVYYNKSYRYVHASYVELQEPPAPPEEEVPAEPVINQNFEQELAAFPSSYHQSLRALHEEYPTWHFKARNIDFTWKEALAKQITRPGINTIPSNKPDSYKAVSEDTYNFDQKYYYGFDGSSWLAASKKAVAYYMDPRNWLDEINVFMFESLSFDADSQKESMVKQLLSSTSIPTQYSASYMTAGVTYNISPVYLAAKSKLELGSSSFMVDGHQFTYGGKTYKGYYNVYNIGAYDSASGGAALNGLYYAASGSSYLRPWNTLDKAIRGGAKFIAEDFVGNNQHTAYYEHFNVANTLDEVGTHVYMTNTMAAATHANITYWDYRDHGMIDTAFTFEIPVFNNMPEKPAAAPGKGNNNCYLDSLKVYNGDRRLYFKTAFNRFTSAHTLKTSVGAEVKDLTIKATTNAADAKVKITGNTNLKIGENKITVKVTSSAGIVKTYTIHVTKLKTSTVVVAPEIKLSSDAETGKNVISWEKAMNADEYKVYRSIGKTGSYALLKTTTELTYTDTKAKAGTKYYYKVKAVGTSGIIGEAVSAIKYLTCDLPMPKVYIGNREFDGNPQLTWDAIEGAVKYEIYRSDSKDGTYVKLFTQKGTLYTNTKDTVVGDRYYYQVRAIHENDNANSAYSMVVSRVRDLPRPKVKVTNHQPDGKPELTWEAVEGAVSYAVYRASKQSDTFDKIHTTEDMSFIDSSAKSGAVYQYKVKALHELSAANSAYSKAMEVKCLYPELVIQAKNRPSDGKIQITWDALEGAEKYEVYRSTSLEEGYKKMFTTKKTSYTNTSAKSGEAFYYQVKAYGDVSEDGEPVFSQPVKRRCDLPQPVVKVSNRPKDGKVKLTWDAIEGAEKYVIYCAEEKDGTYKRLYTRTLTSHVHTKGVAGKMYYYKVKAIHEEVSTANSAYSEVKGRTCDLARPAVEIKLRASDGKPKLTWKAIAGADEYDIYYATRKGGKYKKLYTRTGTAHTHIKAEKGKTYYYKVKAKMKDNVNANSAYSTVKKIKSK